jgi:hypothetical protein
MNTITVPVHFTPTEQDAYLDIIRWFEGAKHVGNLVDTLDFDRLLFLYEQNKETGTFFYSEQTMRFYGTRNPHLAAPGVTVELQTNAPDETPRYAITAWMRMPDGEIRPTTFGRRDTLDSARRYARAVHAVWVYAMQAV